MDKMIMTAILLTAATATAGVHPILVGAPRAPQTATRVGPDTYRVQGLGELRTVNCTVSANDMAIRLDTDRRPWVRFYDASGEEEADCQVVLVAGRAVSR